MFKMMLFPIILLVSMTEGVFVNHDIPINDMYVDGDLLIGGLISTRRSVANKVCGGSMFASYIQITHGVKFAIEEVNRNPNILPNVTLGFANLDYCTRTSIALARSTSFLPRARACKRDTCGQRAVNWTVDVDETGFPNYDVVGVIGTAGSSSSQLVSGMLEVYKIPLISYIASSDDLSVPVKQGYFARTVPPDSFQARALVSILSHFNWTYVALVGQEGSYSKNLNKFIKTFTSEKGICIGYEGHIHTEESDVKFDEIVRDLVAQRKARVVVVTINPTSIRHLAQAMMRAGVERQFILVATETFSASSTSGIESGFPLVLATRPVAVQVPEFQEYYKSLPIFNDEDPDPWLGQFDKKEVGCSDVAGPNVTLCSNYTDVTQVPGFHWSNYYAKAMDAALVYAHALDSYLKDHCQQAIGDRDALYTCIKGDIFMGYIHNVSFQGYSQYVKYDPDTYELISSYDIEYFGRDENGNVQTDDVTIGSWTNGDTGLTINETMIYWKYITNFSWTDAGFPQSVCALPCQEDEFYMMGEQPCCWECYRCRDNEVVRADSRGCEVCPVFTWPNDNSSSCHDIPPSYMIWTDTLSLGLASVATLGLAATTALTVIFIKYQNRKVIRGSSRELMIPVMLGLFMSFLTVYTLLLKPHHWSCYLDFFTFHVSCTAIFGPMFLKTLRMRRIFLAAERCELRIKYVNALSQFVMALFIIGLQVAVCVVLAVLWPPVAVLVMPVRTVQYVELTCSMPYINLLLPLSLNLLLLILCSVLGFLTRKLPDNFNESWHIFISVVTTLFLWVAFIPTYVLAFYAYHKAALLCLALLLTGVVTSLCFLVPKAYAVFFVDEKNIKTSNFDQSNFECKSTTNRSSKVTEETSVSVRHSAVPQN